MNRYHLALLAVIAAIIILLFYAWPAHAATAPVFDAPSISCPENSVNCSLIINKSAVAKSYSKIEVKTVDGTAKAGVDYLSVDKTITIANNTLRTLVYIPVLDNSTYQGSRTFAVALICVRYCQVAGPTTVTITDNDIAPPPPPPPPPVTWTKCADENGTCTIIGTANVRYGSASTWVTKAVTGSVLCANTVFGDPLPGVVKECDTDGAVANPPPPTAQWISAPLRDGNFARVKANDDLWNMTGPGAGRQLRAGEIVAVYFNGWGVQADGRTSYAIYALSDGTSGRAYADDLEGVAPIGSPPGLPVDWWVPGLVTANKTCPNAYDPARPGVTQGGVYRAAMVAGTHAQLAAGQTGWASATWYVIPAGDLNFAPRGVVTGDCLTGN